MTEFIFIFCPISLLTMNPHRALIAGGGAPEIHISRLLSQYAHSLKGMEAYCFQAYADALEVIPTTLAENAGLNPIAIVTELRNRHALGEVNAGINVRKVSIMYLPIIGDVELSIRASSPTSWRRTLCSPCSCRRVQLSSRQKRFASCSRSTTMFKHDR